MSEAGPLRSVHVDTERTWGGGQRQVAWLAAGLVRRDHAACVMARPDSRYAEELRGSGAEVAPLTPVAEWDLLAAGRIRAVARRFGAGVVVAHAAHAAALAAFATAGTDLRLVVTRRVAHPLRRSALSRWKHRRADLIVAVSLRVRDALLADGVDGERIRVVHSGVDLGRPALPAAAATLRALGLDPGLPIAVMVSSLTPPYKDPETFLRAMAAARRARPDIQGLLVGGGPLLAGAVRTRAALGLEAAVVLAGHRDDAERLLAAASVAVLSSRDEGLGTTLLDAMLWGVPVAATAAGGVREVVRDGVDGLLSPPGDGEALGAHVLVILAHGALRERLVASGRQRVRDFSVDRMVEGTIDAYRHALYSARC
ncbi:MAG: glycosyltransferase family 4 protein [Gemmatimonadales bacterium]|jgi:glycosyltransferase involved in cell wall biosynthesis